MSSYQKLVVGDDRNAGIKNLRSYLSVVQLRGGQILAETQQPVQKIYFASGHNLVCGRTHRRQRDNNGYELAGTAHSGLFKRLMDGFR
jgi:hypothetical protein